MTNGNPNSMPGSAAAEQAQVQRATAQRQRPTLTCMFAYVFGRCGLPTIKGTRRCIAHTQEQDEQDVCDQCAGDELDALDALD